MNRIERTPGTAGRLHRSMTTKTDIVPSIRTDPLKLHGIEPAVQGVFWVRSKLQAETDEESERRTREARQDKETGRLF